ncbi:hypothetical protein TrCOL_g11841 [Triparma columacea]|uniref:TAP42-like protein n=1 Tax=Triparma columacea TaxID=722753 RepID=A0A9W7G2D3_9STRA|nr:hypothetical protein TrCOL_g11841 [Triparma columacea]
MSSFALPSSDSSPSSSGQSGGDTNTTTSSKFDEGVVLLEDKCNYVDALVLFDEVNTQISTLSLFSTNESISDVQTPYLKFLLLPFYKMLCMMGCRTDGAAARLSNVKNAQSMGVAFLTTIESLGGEVMGEDNVTIFHKLLGEMGGDEEDGSVRPRARGSSRDEKVARFRAQQKCSEEIKMITGKLQRRGRMDLSPEEMFEGGDEESLIRSLTTQQLKKCATQCIDELISMNQELEMLEMSAKFQSNMSARSPQELEDERIKQRDAANKGSGIKMTQVSIDPTSNQLLFKRQEARDGVFRPGWNLPTMTLQELGEIEYRDAMERAERDKEAEIRNKDKPTRYEYLVRDGLEDDIHKVDASAKVDRDWDDFKDANPRGWGNKMADVGDRNF